MRPRHFPARILALILVILMLFSLVPFSALAEESSVSQVTSVSSEEDEDADAASDFSTSEVPEENSPQETSPDSTDALDDTEDGAEPVLTDQTDLEEPLDQEELESDRQSSPLFASILEDTNQSEPAEASDQEETQVIENGYLSTTTAWLETATASTKKITIESYLTHLDDTVTTVKPCDIIFILDQSKWMNTVEDSGAQRAAVISEINELLSSLEDPTYGEHRVAIAGYGRLNMNANTDAYNASIYPGTRASGNNISLNTGYYTPSGFVSQNGWSDVSQSAMTTAALPQMAASYRATMTYDNTFMTLDEAESVLNVDTMMAWYAGASRMDAGLTLAEQLATVADANDPDGERNLIVCILASSLPIQNTAAYNISTIRTNAVLTAADQLKDLDATIFAFGDYHASGKTMAGTIQDTEENFNYYMQQLCSDPDYFYSFSSFTSVTEALNTMISEIAIVASGEAQVEHTVTVSEITAVESEDQHTFSVESVLEYFGANSDDILENTVVRVDYYKFTGYVDGSPTFEDTPSFSTDTRLKDLVQGDQLIFTTDLIPLPSLQEESDSGGAHSHYGTMVQITISAPLTVTYQWASSETDYAPSNAGLPAAETVAWGTTHFAASVRSISGQDYDEHYEFAGWYTDPACTTAYTGTETITSDLILYGKWVHYLLVEYYWDFLSTGYTESDSLDKVLPGTIPETFTPEQLGYTFDGWYLEYWFTDEACTNLYTPEPLTEDLTLYAKWVPRSDTEYMVKFYQQELEGDDYTEVTDDSYTATGTTDAAISAINKTYPGFTLDHITYESSSLTAQSEALTIQPDGSLVVRVYYNRNSDTEYTVRFYQQDVEGDGYTEVAGDSYTAAGTTGAAISAIDDMTYPGFTLDHITYESSSLAAQSEALPIQPDGSLVVRVYYDRNTYTVTYDGGGSDGGTLPTDDTTYRYGATVTVAQDTMTREHYDFTGWNRAEDGSDTGYAPEDTFVITEDTTLYAQWEYWTFVPTGVSLPNTGLFTVVAVTSGLGLVLLVLRWRKKLPL